MQPNVRRQVGSKSKRLRCAAEDVYVSGAKPLTAVGVELRRTDSDPDRG